MITIHENGKTYKIQLRAHYSHIRSEKKLREMINNTIESYKEKNPRLYESLKQKSLFELFSIWGICTNKWIVEK